MINLVLDHALVSTNGGGGTHVGAGREGRTGRGLSVAEAGRPVIGSQWATSYHRGWYLPVSSSQSADVDNVSGNQARSQILFMYQFLDAQDRPRLDLRGQVHDHDAVGRPLGLDLR
jgi:hypothetical protein